MGANSSGERTRANDLRRGRLKYSRAHTALGEMPPSLAGDRRGGRDRVRSRWSRRRGWRGGGGSRGAWRLEAWHGEETVGRVVGDLARGAESTPSLLASWSGRERPRRPPSGWLGRGYLGDRATGRRCAARRPTGARGGMRRGPARSGRGGLEKGAWAAAGAGQRARAGRGGAPGSRRGGLE
jgi:hypothetical protein